MVKESGVDLLSPISRLGNSGRGFAIVSFIKESGEVEKAILEKSGHILGGALDKEALEAARNIVNGATIRSPRVQMCEMEGVEGVRGELVVEIVSPKIRMNVFGAGHVGQSVCMVGALLGYSVMVYDDRQDLLTRERFPDHNIRLSFCDFDNVSSAISEIENSVVVIVTRGHQFDEECLRAVIGAGAAYIGMIGSKRRVLSIFRKLIGNGIKDDILQAVHAPIGLKIGAVSPQEIAVSIMAEVIQVLNQGSTANRE
jgi:xanthine dehydrogenase accessory factor